MNQPRFKKGDVVIWSVGGDKKLAEQEVIMDDPSWDTCWECWTYWFGGLCRVPEDQIETDCRSQRHGISRSKNPLEEGR